jgi:hypothetical protein
VSGGKVTKTGRKRRRTRNVEPQAPSATKPPQRDEEDEDRVHGWFSVANKWLLAAVGTGIAGVITAAVLAVPGWVTHRFRASPAAITVAGTAGSRLAGPSLDPNGPIVTDTDSCSLAGIYLLPGDRTFTSALSTEQLRALVASSPDVGGVTGTYVVQAAPGQTVVVTGLHTVILNRIPAPKDTIVKVAAVCAECRQTDNEYHASIDLDSNDLVPQIEFGSPDCASRSAHPFRTIHTVVTDANPLIIDFIASTNNNDVTFEIRIDYIVNGRQRSAFVMNGDEPFHAVATRPDDYGVTFTQLPSGNWVPD